jgi:hypothetical protein
MLNVWPLLTATTAQTTEQEVERVASDWLLGLGILVLLVLLAALVLFVVHVRRAGEEGRAIIYTSWTDVFIGVFLPAAGMITAVALLMSASDSESGLGGIAGIITLSASAGWYVLQNIAQAVRWNSGGTAVIIAVFRLGFFWAWAISLLLILRLISPNTERGGKTVSKTVAQLALAAAIAWGIWRFLKGFITPPNEAGLALGNDD